jgi:lipopolysaccharide transport system ATP-binding protein
MTVEMTFEVLLDIVPDLVPNIYFYTAVGECAFFTLSDKKIKYKKGRYTVICCIPGHLLNEGAYFIGLAISSYTSSIVTHFFERNALSFNVNDTMSNNPTRSGWVGTMLGVVRPILSWKTHEL